MRAEYATGDTIGNTGLRLLAPSRCATVASHIVNRLPPNPKPLPGRDAGARLPGHAGGLAGRAFPLLVLLSAGFGALAAAPGDPPRRVLLLHSFEREVAPFKAVASAFRTTLARELGEPLDLTEASLEAGRVSVPGTDTAVLEYLAHRFSSQRPELVVPVGAPAALFVVRHRDALFPGIPALFAGADPRVLAPEHTRSNATIVTVRVNLPAAVEEMLRLQPATTNIVVVFGSSPFERYWEAECRREFAPFHNRVTFAWWSGLALEEMRLKIRTLPPRSFVFYAMLTTDGAGVPYDHDDALRALHTAASAPIYGYFASQFGLGAVGGRLYADAALGIEAARTAVRLLHGTPVAEIPPQFLEPAPPLYDWRELQRWDLLRAPLPADSTVAFREPTFWQRYRGRVIASAAVGVVQTALIFCLGVLLIQRRRAERSLRASEERLTLATTAANVGIWVWDIDKDEVWGTPGWFRLFGFSEGERPDLRQVIARLHPDDRPEVEACTRRAVAEGTAYQGEFRIPLPDGTQRWVAARGQVDNGSTTTGRRFVGASVDITDRRRAEELAQAVTGRLLTVQEEERARLARELHDDITQRLARLAIDVGRCELGTTDRSPAETAREVREGLVRLSEDVHALSYRLHPAVLEELGLVEALRTEAHRFQRRDHLRVELALAEIPGRVPDAAALGLFRVAQEALQNVTRHAGARGVRLSLRVLDDGLQLAVSDDGRGFDPAVAGAGRTLGLASMRERIHLLGGELEIESQPGQGTTVLAWVPFNGPPGPRSTPTPTPPP